MDFNQFIKCKHFAIIEINHLPWAFLPMIRFFGFAFLPFLSRRTVYHCIAIFQFLMDAVQIWVVSLTENVTIIAALQTAEPCSHWSEYPRAGLSLAAGFLTARSLPLPPGTGENCNKRGFVFTLHIKYSNLRIPGKKIKCINVYRRWYCDVFSILFEFLELCGKSDGALTESSDWSKMCHESSDWLVSRSGLPRLVSPEAVKMYFAQITECSTGGEKKHL